MSDDAHLLIGRSMGQVMRRENKTESYVCIPPALWITDSDGSTWTFGTEYIEHHNEYEFNVLRNDVDTGEFAKRIEYKNGVVRIFGQAGWRSWGRSRKGFI